MQESQDKIANALRDKLYNYEKPVSRSTGNAVLSRLQAVNKKATIVRRSSYSAGVIALVATLYYFMPSDIESVSMVSAASSAAMINPVDKPAGDNQSPQSRGISQENVTISEENKPSVLDNRALTAPTVTESSLAHTEQFTTESAPGYTPGIVSFEPISETSKTIVSSDLTLEEDDQIIAPSEELRTDTNIAEPALPTRRWSLSVGIMPTTNYKRIVPNHNDAVYLHNFETPGSVHKSRFGLSGSLTAHYLLAKKRSIYGGVGFFNYKTQFTYNSNETSSSVGMVNDVNETLTGFSLHAGLQLPLGSSDKQKLNIGGQLQFPGASPQAIAQIGADFGRKFGQGLFILQPVAFYSITPRKYNGLGSHPYGIGLDLRYQLPLSREQ